MSNFSLSAQYVLQRAEMMAEEESEISVTHLVGAVLERITVHAVVQQDAHAVMQLFKRAGLKWDDETRRALGIVTAEEKAEMKERAELARLRAKYPED
jgi:hypothetical protein